MKLWFVAGLFTALMAPLAAAETTTTANCDVDDTQRSVQQRVDAAPAPAPPARTVRGGASSGGQRGEAVAPPTPRNEAARRRGVSRRIPDAELIGGRGAL